MVERLKDTPRIFKRALDIGAHNGLVLSEILRAERAMTGLAGDLSGAMVAAARARGLGAELLDAERLSFEPGAFDLVVSGLSLHWVNDLPGALVQIRNVLEPDGLFLGALFGAGTLAELRGALIEAETEIRGGAAPRVSPLPGLRDMAALLQRAGFALPVADRETVIVRYDAMMGLLDDLKGMGERAAFARGMGQPLSRRILERAADIYQADNSDPDGRVRATFEIIWLSGWSPGPYQPQPLKPGSAKISLTKAIPGASL